MQRVIRMWPVSATCSVALLLAGCEDAPTSSIPTPAPQRTQAATADVQAKLVAAGKPSPTTVQPQFVDVAEKAGIQFTYENDARPGRFFLPEVMSGSALWFDYDLDGHWDLLLPNGCRLPDRSSTPPSTVFRLYRNRSAGAFQDVSFEAGAAQQAFGQGGAAADFDADGFVDVYLANYGSNLLLVNHGDGTFADETAASGTGDNDTWSTGAVWFDADRDGDEDLYVVNYLEITFENHKVCQYHGVDGYCGPGSFQAQPDRFYQNCGDGRFVECSESFGLQAENGKGMGVVALDLDDDLSPEIFVANDMCPNFLFTRSGVAPTGTGSALYREAALEGGCALSGAGEVEAGMGIAPADFDGDGLCDLALTHYYARKNTLYRNSGGLRFHDDSYVSRLAAHSKSVLGFGIVPIDYDRDGAADLFIANGHVLGPHVTPNEMQSQLLHNDGRGRFDDVSSQAGEYFAEQLLARGAASADFDNDGDLDIAVGTLHRPVALLRNDTSVKSHWLGLHLATPTRLAPVGGRVVVTVGGRDRVQPIVAGGSYQSNNDTRLLFGLGEAAAIDRVRIFWPSGRVDDLTDLEVDRYWHIVEGRQARPIETGS